MSSQHLIGSIIMLISMRYLRRLAFRPVFRFVRRNWFLFLSILIVVAYGYAKQIGYV